MKVKAILFGAMLATLPCVAAGADELERLTSSLPFPMTAPKLPSIPDRSFPIIRFGAIGDGQTSSTAAFKQAIDACAKAGGGRVVVPRGMWLTGPIQLVSNVELHLESGSVILFSRSYQEYSSRGTRAISPISANGAENIAITGQGIIDGSGDAWRPVKKSKMTAAQWSGLIAGGGVLNKAGDTWYPTAASLVPGAVEAMRPHMVEFTGCKRVLLDGPTFQNSPNWNLHPLLSEDVVIRNITVLNPWYSQNGDGLDIDACRRVVVYDSRFDVGDDAICLKSGAGEAARRRGRATEEVVIARCTVYHGHGGVTIGSEMSGGIRKVFVDECVFLGTDMGLRFKSTRGRGGVVEDLYFRNVSMRGIATDAIGFTMSYGGDAPGEEEATGAPSQTPAVNDGTPRFRNIHFATILCVGARRAVHLEGLPELPIEGVDLTDVTISAQTGFETLYARNVRANRLHILSERGPVFRIADSQEVVLEKASGPQVADTFLVLSGAATRGIRLVDSTVTGSIQTEKGAASAALIRQ